MSPVAVLLTRLLAVEKEPFRAQGSHRQPGRDRRPRRARLPRCGSRQRRRLRPARSGCTACPRGGRGLRARRSVGRGKLSDRKSTRLNSSHLVISYAVFCFKKKNHRALIHVNAVLTMTPIIVARWLFKL